MVDNLIFLTLKVNSQGSERGLTIVLLLKYKFYHFLLLFLLKDDKEDIKR